MKLTFVTIIPLLTAFFAFAVALGLFFRPGKMSKVQRYLFFASPWVVLLQAGTFLLLAADQQNLRLVGGNVVLWSLSILTPICTHLALLWGAGQKNLLKKHKVVLALQWLLSLFFCAAALSGKALVSTAQETEVSLNPGFSGHYFMIYLIVSSVFILSIFERKLRSTPAATGLRLPTIAYMATFVFFIITASQGLLIHAVHPNSLLLISVSIFLGFTFPLVLRSRTGRTFNPVPENRETVYSSFMILLVGAYLILIGVIGKVIATVGGDLRTFFSVVGGAAAVLFLLTFVFSSSVKTRIRKFADRVIYRGKYDYRAIWARFGEETAFAQTLDDLLGSVLDNVTNILGVGKGVILLRSPGVPGLVLAKKKILVVARSWPQRSRSNLLIGYGGSGSRWRSAILSSRPQYRPWPSRQNVDCTPWVCRCALRCQASPGWLE